jgi:hypothetical protein
MNRLFARLFARLLVVVVMAFLGAVARAVTSAQGADAPWLLSATPCAQCQ